jgi:hypothetical protein
MSHPKDRRERFFIGCKKGKKRASGLLSYREKIKNPDLLEKFVQHRRDTTELCSCPMCGNPRKYFGEETIQQKRNSGWKSDLE